MSISTYLPPPNPILPFFWLFLRQGDELGNEGAVAQDDDFLAPADLLHEVGELTVGVFEHDLGHERAS